jgi:hypothetical protein
MELTNEAPAEPLKCIAPAYVAEVGHHEQRALCRRTTSALGPRIPAIGDRGVQWASPFISDTM